MEPPAVLILALEVEVWRPIEPITVAVAYREVADTRVEPHIQDVGFLDEGRGAAVGARISRRQQLMGIPNVPGVGTLLEEDSADVIEYRFVDGRRPARFTGQDGDRYAPQPLSRDAPVGAVFHHSVDARLAPARNPADGVDGVLGPLTKVMPVHADEPLVGGAEDDGVFRPPAVGIGVLDLAVGNEDLELS